MPLSRNSLLPALAACCVALPCAAAQDEPATAVFDEIVVTASRVPQPLRRVGISLTVLDGADLRLRGNLALQDILRQTPAVSVSNTGGAGKTSTLRIRGEDGYRTLLILDGIRLLDPSGTQLLPPFEHVLSSGLGRVEILRGPQGLGYGADAGGVVNMSSLPSTGTLNANLDLQSGAFGTQQLSGVVAGGSGRGDFSLIASDMTSDGFNAQTADTVLRDDDGYDNTTIHARAGFDISDTLRLDLVHRDVRGFAAFDGCFHPVTFALEHDCATHFDLDASRAALTYAGAQHTQTLSYATTGIERDSLATGQSAFTAQGTLDRWEYLGHARQLPGFALVYGADYEDARINGHQRANKGLFTEFLSDFSDRLHLGAGLRYDANDDFGGNTSYRLNAAYLIDAGASATLKLKSSYGTGFRAPSPYEIVYNATYATPPASSIVLEQETSKGYEAGFEYLHDSGLHLDAVYFSQQVTDAIDFDLVNYSGYLQQSGNSTSDGVELAASAPLARNWRLLANYTWNETERPDGQQRRRRPEQQFNLGASWTGMQQGLTLSAFYRAARDAIDETFAGVSALDDFGVLDVGAEFRVGARVQLYARVENLLDEQYEELTGYNSADRAAYIGVRFSY